MQREHSARWFRTPEEASRRGPQAIAPSGVVLDAAVAAAVVIREVVSLGERPHLRLPAGQMTAVGNALHGIFAVDLGPGDAGREEVAAGLIRANGLEGSLPVDVALAMSERFSRWLTKHASGPRLPEWPVRWRKEDGTAMAGDIDLLAGLDEGWMVLDHKSFPGGRQQRDARLLKWAGQLWAYSEAVEAATAQPVRETWIHLPLRAEVVRLELRRP